MPKEPAKPRKKKLEQRVTVSLDSDVFQEIQRLAEKNHVTVSWVVRHALSEFLRGKGSGQFELDI